MLFFEIVCGVPAGVIKHGKLENPEAFDLGKKKNKHLNMIYQQAMLDYRKVEYLVS